MSRSAAETLCLNRPHEIQHLLSITSPGDEKPIQGFQNIKNRLWLRFSDDSEPTPYGPKRKHVEKAIEFGRKCQSMGGTLLIHCEAGVSRSTGMAFVILCDHMGVTKEEAAMEEVFRIRSQSHPNLMVVTHADDILGRRGAMVRMAERARIPTSPYKIVG